MGPLIDSHCHLFDMKKGYILPDDIYPVIVGFSDGSNRKAAALAKEKGYPFVLGIAPQTAIKEGTKKLDAWVSFIRSAKPNAIGEVGLDYKWAETREHVDSERTAFSAMIALAKEMGLPLVIHSRNNPNENGLPKDAVEDILAMLMGERFLMHFFSGTAEQAEAIVRMGGYISVAHMRSKEKRKVINSVPLDRLLIESDAPYVGRTPESIRGAAAYIAEVKGISVEEAAEATARNAMAFFSFRL
ncbi:MAG: TatD family hydrolase [Candidatus Micrarchaeota archaeon]